MLSLHKSGLYYQAKGESLENLELMKKIDKRYTQYPHMGVPSMTTWLRKDEGILVNHKRVERLYKVMNIRSLAPGVHTSKGCKEHKKYPYLLRGLKIEHVHQVWETDITYIPMEKGFFYLMAIIDVKSRYILHWSLSNTMDADWCKQTIQECVEEYGKPTIVNTDQGSQYTSEVFTEYLLSQDIQISMDGKGRAIDNIYIERFWRSLKYEKIYLNVYETGQTLHLGIIEYMNYYNYERRHQSLGDFRPIDIFAEGKESLLQMQN